MDFSYAKKKERARPNRDERKKGGRKETGLEKKEDPADAYWLFLLFKSECASPPLRELCLGLTCWERRKERKNNNRLRILLIRNSLYCNTCCFQDD